MQCTASGIVSNITPGTDTLTKIEIVWLPTDTTSGNLQARANAESVNQITITDATAIANFQGSGTTISSPNIVNGTSYIFAIRCTETRSGTDYSGLWTNSDNFTPITPTA